MVEGINDNEVEARRTAEEVARRSYGKLVAFLAARTRDVAAAEDALSDAFRSSSGGLPRNGCPANPEAWLMTVGQTKNDRRRSPALYSESAAGELQLLAEGLEAAAAESEIPDRRLALLFACATPAIDIAVRAPLMLQVVVGAGRKTIASAFLMSPQPWEAPRPRQGKIRQAGIPFPRSGARRTSRPPRHRARCHLLPRSTEGWSDPGGTDVVRRDLTAESMFLARLVVELLPQEAEAIGLLSLMLHAEARRRARRSAQGEYVPLAEQDSALWDWHGIGEGRSALLTASALGSIGRYQIEAALQIRPRAPLQHRSSQLGRSSGSCTTLCSKSPPPPVVAITGHWQSRSCTGRSRSRRPCPKRRAMFG